MDKIKQLPNNIEAEKALLGSILMNDGISKIENIVTPVSFYLDKNKIIYSNMLSMYKNKEHTDLLTLSDSLRNSNKLDEIGGISYLTELATCVPSNSNMVEYAKIIADKYARRQLIQLAEKIADTSHDESQHINQLLSRTDKALKAVSKISGNVQRTGSESLDNIISSLEKEIVIEKSDHSNEQLSRLNDIAMKYAGEDKMISSHDFIENIKNQPKQVEMLTKIPKLDELLKGFRVGQLVSISAIAKSGKTSFCMELTSNLREYNPAWFPFEEGADELLSKFMERGETPPIFFTPKVLKDRSLDFIERKIIEAKAKYDSKVFFIDNLDWIVDPRSANHDREIQAVCMELKRMCVQWEVCIVLIAHVKKLETSTKQPDYNDIKGSSAVYQISDTVIMLWRETVRNNNGEIEISNNVNISLQFNRKYGKTGNIKMTFDNGHYKEYDWKVDDDSFGDFSTKKLKI